MLGSGLSGPGSTVLCSWAKHFIVIVPLSTQERKMGTSDRGNHVDVHPIPGGGGRGGGEWKEEVAILLVSIRYRNQRKAPGMVHLA